MAKKLMNLKITKVSLVDEGACSAAHITLFKNKKGGNEVMNFDEIMKSLTEDQQAIIKAEMDAKDSEITKAKEECSQKETDLEKSEKEKKDLETKVSELEGEVEKATEKPAEDDEEELLKSVDPAVRAILQKAKAEAELNKKAVLKMKEEQETAELTDIAKSLNGVGTEETQIVSMLKKAKNVDAALYAEVLGVLKAANNIIADSELLKEKGQTGGENTGNAWSNIEAKATEIAKTRNITHAKATEVVLDEFPELYNAYVNEMK